MRMVASTDIGSFLLFAKCYNIVNINNMDQLCLSLGRLWKCCDKLAEYCHRYKTMLFLECSL